jgi:methionyl-tRNA synthetase
VQSGTDDHAIKNVSAAETADEFLRTARDPRHAPGVRPLWRACQAAGDLYPKDYAGRYCPGCEQFFTPDELDDGACTEHRAPVVEVTETNWFFRSPATATRSPP